MMDFRADLHCHSTCSDGSLTPQEIIQLASKSGLSGLSITDHDIIEGYALVKDQATELNIQLLPGVELSTIHNGFNVHILAYGFSFPNPVLESFCDSHFAKRRERNRKILQLLTQHGMPLSEEEVENAFTDGLQKSKSITTRPHIALAMVKKGYIQDTAEAFRYYIGEGKSCYASGGYPSVEETIATIHKAGGLAVIAHPHLITNQRVVHDLLAMNFDGIEAYYARLSPIQEERWIKIGRKKNWLITGGSDFHGDCKPNISLGCSWIDLTSFNYLFEHFQKNQLKDKHAAAEALQNA